jgi:hypothetical protein
MTLLLLTGCSNGQLVDAGGERGAGGLAFVVMTGFFDLLRAGSSTWTARGAGARL